MKSKTTAAAVAVIFMVAAGCTTLGMSARQAAVTTSHVIALEDSFDRVEPIVEEHIDAVAPEDRDDVRQAWDTLLTIRDEIRDDDPAQVLTNVGRSQNLYRRSRTAYMTLRPIAKKLIANGTIPTEDAFALKRIDQRAQTLDDKLQNLERNQATVAALRFARDVVPLVSRVIVALA